MFERLAVKEARAVAESFFSEPNQEHFDGFMTTCLPMYNPTPLDPDVLARVRFRLEVAFPLFGGEASTYNWSAELDRIRCPTLILAGELDPITTVVDHEEMAAAISESRLEVFAEAGHGVFRDEPDEALAVIGDFIAS